MIFIRENIYRDVCKCDDWFEVFFDIGYFDDRFYVRYISVFLWWCDGCKCLGLLCLRGLCWGIFGIESFWCL